MRTGRPRVAPEVRFWTKVRLTPTCWLWTGHTNHGYGHFWHGTGMVYAHRWAYERLIGPVPEGLQLDHLCRNRACVRPDHLEPVTGRENTLRGEGITAVFARATHCRHGHPLTVTGARRRCLTCQADADRRYKTRKKALA